MKPSGRPSRKSEPTDGSEPTPDQSPDRPLPAEIGIPPISIQADVPPPEAIPPAGPGEKPDRSDDTANVPLDVLLWVKAAKAILLAEGFKREPLRQARKPGMVWGVIRQEP